MSQFLIPTLETERLILRAPQESDFEAVATFGASPRSASVGGPYTRWESWRGFLGIFGHWHLRGYGFWMLETRADAQIAGRVGIAMHDGWDEPELGWHIYDGFEGQGLAYEAAVAVRAYGAANQNLPRPISYIAPSNARSLALADRLGATFERQGEVLGIPCHVYRHPLPEAA